MAILQVRDLPEDLHKKLTELAESEHRSLSQQVTVLLKQALGQTQASQYRRAKALDSIKETFQKKEKRKFSDPVKLLREDRER